MMKDLYLSPAVEMKAFDKKDVIATSESTGHGTNGYATDPGEVWIPGNEDGQG